MKRAKSEGASREPFVSVRRSASNSEIEVWSFHNWLRAGAYSAPLATITAPIGDCVRGIRARHGLRRDAGDASGILVTLPGEVVVVEQLLGRQPHVGERTIVGVSVPQSFFESASVTEVVPGLLQRAGHPSLRESLVSLVATLERADAPRCQLESRVLELFDVVARGAQSETPRVGPVCRRSLERSKEFIHAHVAEAFSLEELAQAAGLSKWHLIRSFRAQFGIAPGEYVRSLRVQRALTMIRDGVAPSVAAAAAGYADQAHMGREVRAVGGLTPARYGRLVERLPRQDLGAPNL